jgi:hypothetical protein
MRYGGQLTCIVHKDRLVKARTLVDHEFALLGIGGGVGDLDAELGAPPFVITNAVTLRRCFG